MIFKNRPTPNIDINPAENNLSLEIVSRYGKDLTAAKGYIAKGSAMELANAVRSYLATYGVITFKNDTDSIEISGGGTDWAPAVHVSIDHQSPSGEILGRGLYIQETEAEKFVASLEQWAKHPDL